MAAPPRPTERASLLSHPVLKAALPFLNGGAAGMLATTIIQPVDMVKVRLQLANTTTTTTKPTALHITRDLLRTRPLDLYSGLSAGLLRQAIYTTARMGFFSTFLSSLRTRSPHPLTFRERAAASLAAGGLAAVLGNPADLALIRMQSDGLLPAPQRQRYPSVFHALAGIARKEGIRALWAGCVPTVLRAMALNFGQLAFYSETKVRMEGVWRGRRWGEAGRKGVASAVAGFAAAGLSLPFDFVKTRMQRGGGYSGPVDCAVRVAREEGLGRFYRGFGTYYVRIAPHAMLTVLFADWFLQLTKVGGV